jgi:SWI/SNF-related matrix-associated actin-dependent regulator 1 of chromatin subfamily A
VLAAAVEAAAVEAAAVEAAAVEAAAVEAAAVEATGAPVPEPQAAISMLNRSSSGRSVLRACMFVPLRQ